MNAISHSARRRAQRRTPAVVSPIALDAVRRIDALFEVERSINGLPADRRFAVRREQAAPLVAALEAWMREERRKLSRHTAQLHTLFALSNLWMVRRRFLPTG